MKKTLNIKLLQINPTVGALENNYNLIKKHYNESKDADLIITPELSLTGYPLEDLVLNRDLLSQTQYYLEQLKDLTKNKGQALIVGAPYYDGKDIYNSAFVFADGKLLKRLDKTELPNTEVFDEKRYFKANSTEQTPLEYKGFNLGLLICEDTWHKNVAKSLENNGADVLISMNASPFRLNVHETRKNIVKQRITETNLPVIYLNIVGGQDELVFDGGSFVMTADGEVVNKLPAFEESRSTVILIKNNNSIEIPLAKICHEDSAEEAQMYQAMMLGLKDYISKTNSNNIKPVVFGLSGGLDSSIVACIAADAIGAENVNGILMPSKYTSDMSNNDAIELSENLGSNYKILPIKKPVDTFDDVFNPHFHAMPTDVTEENIQARIRGLMVMAFSNKFGYMPLSTGNKSEMAVGYCTLYGDMCGGFNPIKDLYKTQAFKLAKWRNNNIPKNAKVQKLNIMPENIIVRPPSAELAPGQVDTNSLPEYEVLDFILEQIVEHDLTIDEIVAKDVDKATVLKVYALLNRAEFKRRQASPGIKLTNKALRSNDRRYPIVNGMKLK